MILLQCAHGKHVCLLELARKHHARIFDAWRIVEKIGTHLRYRPDLHPGWNKFFYLADLFESEPDGAEILYMDNDALALKPFQFQDALPLGYDLAGVMNVWHRVNSGVMFWRNSPYVRSVLGRIIRCRSPNGSDQDGLHLFIAALKVHHLSPRWNLYKNANGRQRADPIIQAWHGEGLENAKRGMSSLIHRTA